MAYNLAQEAMEETRRSRDSNWDDLKSDTRWENDSIELLSSENTTCTEDGTNLLCDIDGKKFTLTRTMRQLIIFHHYMILPIQFVEQISMKIWSNGYISK
jgi:hypothetical protein